MKWSPDTCGCTVVKDGLPVKVCPAHAGVPPAELYGVVLFENTRKNLVHAALIGDDPAAPDLGLGEPVPVEPVALPTHDRAVPRAEMLAHRERLAAQAARVAAGQGPKRLREGVAYSYEFSGTGKDRILRAYVQAGPVVLTKKHKDDLKAHCEMKFGAGKVEIVHE